MTKKRPTKKKRQKQLNDRLIGARVREARKEIGFPLSILGETIGVNLDAVSKKEMGVYAITAEQIAKLAKLLEKPVEFFLQDVR